MAYRYLGSATTNAQGVAELPITGYGKGELDIVASTSNPISGSSLVSEPYEVLDALFYDSGVSGTLNTDWVVESGLTATPSSTGILLENSTSGGKYLGANLHDTTTGELKDFNTPLVVEFTAISGTGVRFFVNTSTGGTNIDKNFTSSITGDNKFKFIIRQNSYDLIIDDGTPVTTSCNLVNPVGVRFVVNGSCNFKFKDFKIYPI